VPVLVEAFLRRVRRARGGARRAFSEGAMRRLVAHDWPGNVRELQHVVERACVMSAAEVIDEADLGLPPASPASTSGLPTSTDEPADLDLRRAVENLERSYVERALKRAGGNRAEAARLLGIARPQLYAKMKDLGIDPGERRGGG
jgi:DNA-binding NtrC family response regulator